LEHVTRPLVLDDETEVEPYVFAFEHLRATALNPADSAELLERMAEQA
jgi:Domain of unknown function (DUF5753)